MRPITTETSPCSRAVLCIVALLAVWGGSVPGAEAQSASDRAAYLRVMTVHFDLPEGEAERLSDAPLGPDELPVLLFLAQESGIAAPALSAMRRTGATWMALSRRSGVAPDRLHVEIPDAVDDPRVRRLKDLFAGTPRTQWGNLDFSDDEMVTLVHLKVLTRRFQLPVARVLAARGEVASWVEVPARLAGP